MKNVADVYPTTPVQEGMLFHTLSAPGGGIYLTQIAFQLDGALDVQAFENAWQQTIEAQATLRTAFLWEGLDSPLQVVRDEVKLPFRFTENALPQDIEAYLEEDRRTDFALEQAPLLRLHLFQLGPETHRLVWSFHHLISDGWSTPLILNEVLLHYNGERPTVSSPAYRTYIDWLQEQDSASHEAYWRNELDGFSQPLLCPRSPGKAGPIRLEEILSIQETEALQAFCKKNRLTLNTLVLGSWIQTLSTWCENADALLGITVSGRPPDLAGVEQIVGNFINTLPLRYSVDAEVTILEWLGKLQEKLTTLREHEHISLTQIQQWSPLQANQSLFDTIFVYESAAILPKSSSLTLSQWEHREQSHYPLAALALPGEALTLLFIAEGSIHQESSLRPVLESWVNALRSIARSEPIAWLSPDRRQEVLVDWNATAHPTTPATFTSFSKQAAQSTALVSGRDRVTYGDLERRANQFAHRLIEMGVKPTERVGILAERGVEFIIAIFGVLKAGACYVPLDSTYPRQRLEGMIKDASMRHLCCQLKLLGSVDLAKLSVIAIDDESLGDQPTTSLDVIVDLSDPAYVIFTSGSSGTPRGVEVSHANLYHSTEARHHFYERPVESFLLLSSFAFDSSVAGIFWTLSQGGKLCLLPEADQYNPTAIAELIDKESITHLLGVPSVIDAFLAESRAKLLKSLRTMIMAGEKCPPALITRINALLPQAALFNEYGPTETTVWATVHRCSPNESPVPIGKPISNTQVYILDAQHRPLPPGFAGELCIGGAGVTLGYINDSDATTERFIPNPINPATSSDLYRTGDKARWRSDGILEFLGRMDDQVQLHGLRIELGEIENAMRSHPAISDAVVTLQPTPVSIDALSKALDALPPDEAEALLKEGSDEDFQRAITTPSFEFKLSVGDPTFVNPPRGEQRQWLLNQALQELRDDLDHLDIVAKRFVPGSTETIQEYDIAQRALSDDEIMEDWQTPIMKAMAEQVTQAHGDVLEIGFGRGVSAEFIQEENVRSHTIIESNDHSIDHYFNPWRESHAASDIKIIHSRWQDAMDQLGTYDGVFFHAFPLDEEEFIETVVQSITFAEHFFPTAARLLRPGGVFTYLTTEIDSMSRRHQRALFQHFKTISMSVQKVSVPENTRDTWWADSMVIIRAEK